MEGWGEIELEETLSLRRGQNRTPLRVISRWCPVSLSRISRLGLAFSLVSSRAPAAIAAATNQTLPDVSPEDHARNEFDAGIWAGVFHWARWSSVGTNIRAGRTEKECLAALGDVLSASTDLIKTRYSASTSLLAVMPTLAVFLGGESKDLWVLLKLAPICGALDCLLSMGGGLSRTTSAIWRGR
ncbi:hypothetical protein GP486_005372 [Trichoglossum hirsutum]|uniref:Uncharacterized protein n=1 Tax=Trichoglossum hirsutum TaxID=265104 RepID=A0A9P8L9D3_9PEZI|nr:hypothetical protein GP486_005372 [Trichoglossum hirsutum]